MYFTGDEVRDSAGFGWVGVEYKTLKTSEIDGVRIIYRDIFFRV